MNADSCGSVSNITVTILKAHRFSKLTHTVQLHNGWCCCCTARSLYMYRHFLTLGIFIWLTVHREENNNNYYYYYNYIIVCVSPKRATPCNMISNACMVYMLWMVCTVWMTVNIHSNQHRLYIAILYKVCPLSIEPYLIFNNRWRDRDVTWQPARGDLSAQPWTVTLPWSWSVVSGRPLR